ncbi:proteasomal ubiquitin receptor adrm1-like protein [Phytophthora cinnamomi]|uniref:proteasomal ubiquitin receptor adrm1-like protein n=1 Tax=Phytophthora cinnamomi TaxID=4785 RepID=UPI0035595024|nr:proteasomal ubiquitin receptor adrm1-like protein [Phytophthora cinnamomi]
MASLQQFAQPKPVSLTKLLSADNVANIFDDPACVEALLPHLPEGSQTPAELRATLRSPQLRQCIGSLVSALQTGNFNAVMANFGLDPASGAAKLAFGDGVGALLAAIQAWADQQDTSMSAPGDQNEASK